MKEQEELTHDEEVSIMLGLQAEVAILNHKKKGGGQITRHDISRLREISEEILFIEKAFNHYPEVKTPLLVKIKNLLLDEIK